MHIISLKMLREFWQKHPEAEQVLRTWHTVAERSRFVDFSDLRRGFRSADYVSPYTVFDVGGNNYRVIAVVRYRDGKIFVRWVLNHREYDEWLQALPKRQGLNMASRTSSLDVKALTRTWTAFDQVARLRPIRNDAEYDRTVALMNALLDVIGDEEDHALAGLLDLVSELVADYDASHHAIETSEPREVLRYLIDQRGLKQSDLADILPQSNLSAILAGKRKISATLAGKLGKYFNVSAAVFIHS